jgi:hypothetical protein
VRAEQKRQIELHIFFKKNDAQDGIALHLDYSCLKFDYTVAKAAEIS